MKGEVDLVVDPRSLALHVDGAKDGVGHDAVFFEPHLEGPVDPPRELLLRDHPGSAQELESVVVAGEREGLSVRPRPLPGGGRQVSDGRQESQKQEKRRSRPVH